MKSALGGVSVQPAGVGAGVPKGGLVAAGVSVPGGGVGDAVSAGEGLGALGVLVGGGDPAWGGERVGEVPGGQRLQEAAQ